MVALLVLSVAALGVACLVLLVRLLMSTATSIGRVPVGGSPLDGGAAGEAAAVSDPEATVSVIRQR
jgi:hypothetical protein